MFSAHDGTLMMIQTALRLTSTECLYDQFRLKKNMANMPQNEKTRITNTVCFEYPEFAATMIFELYNVNKGESYLQLLYNGKVVTFNDQQF